MSIKPLFAVAIATFLLVGCKSKQPETVLAPMGDTAPAFGSDGKSNIQAFTEGNWCLVDPLAGGAIANRYFTFKSGGAFECGDRKEWTSTGKWTASGNAVTLQYDTMDGKPFEDFRAEYKKGEEGGTQVAVARALIYDSVYDQLAKMSMLWVDPDQKHLTFSPPPEPGIEGNVASLGGIQLERMNEKKSGG